MAGPFREWRPGSRPNAADENARNRAIEETSRRSTGIHGQEGTGEHQFTDQYHIARITGIASKVQRLLITATAGSFNLGYNGSLTGALAYNIDAVALQTALLGIVPLGVTVSGSDGDFTIAFNGVSSLLTANSMTTSLIVVVRASVPGWYAWQLLTEDGLLPQTGEFQNDPLGATGPDNNGNFAAYEINGSTLVPTNGSAAVRMWPGQGGEYFIFEWFGVGRADDNDDDGTDDDDDDSGHNITSFTVQVDAICVSGWLGIWKRDTTYTNGILTTLGPIYFSHWSGCCDCGTSSSGSSPEPPTPPPDEPPWNPPPVVTGCCPGVILPLTLYAKITGVSGEVAAACTAENVVGTSYPLIYRPDWPDGPSWVASEPFPIAGPQRTAFFIRLWCKNGFWNIGPASSVSFPGNHTSVFLPDSCFPFEASTLVYNVFGVNNSVAIEISETNNGTPPEGNNCDDTLCCIELGSELCLKGAGFGNLAFNGTFTLYRSSQPVYATERFAWWISSLIKWETGGYGYFVWVYDCAADTTFLTFWPMFENIALPFSTHMFAFNSTTNPFTDTCTFPYTGMTSIAFNYAGQALGTVTIDDITTCNGGGGGSCATSICVILSGATNIGGTCGACTTPFQATDYGYGAGIIPLTFVSSDGVTCNYISPSITICGRPFSVKAAIPVATGGTATVTLTGDGGYGPDIAVWQGTYSGLGVSLPLDAGGYTCSWSGSTATLGNCSGTGGCGVDNSAVAQIFFDLTGWDWNAGACNNATCESVLGDLFILDANLGVWDYGLFNICLAAGGVNYTWTLSWITNRWILILSDGSYTATWRGTVCTGQVYPGPLPDTLEFFSQSGTAPCTNLPTSITIDAV